MLFMATNKKYTLTIKISKLSEYVAENMDSDQW